MSLILDTDNNGITVMAACFVFIAYLLHPLVHVALRKVRAYHAWRAIESNSTIDVTRPQLLPAEMLRGRNGQCDMARAITILLMLFVIASWILELSLGLANVSAGPVDLMDRPPPLFLRNDISNSTVTDGSTSSNATVAVAWEVLDGFDADGIPDSGTLGNFQGTLDSGNATSRYRIENDIYAGSILTAWWSDDSSLAPSDLFYFSSDTTTSKDTASLDSLECASSPSTSGDVYVADDSDDKWGSFKECTSGPVLSPSTSESSSSTGLTDEEDSVDVVPPPVIVLESSTTGTIYMIVEERTGNYPSFLYSVWRARSSEALTTTAKDPTSATEETENTLVGSRVAADGGTKLFRYMFHVASQARLVEAIVTGLVNGVDTGGGCVDLMWQFSEQNAVYAYDSTERSRASPFGEQPGNGAVVEDLSQVEIIEAGIKLNWGASVCLAWLMLVSSVSLVWAACLSSRTGMDVYDRDELIKAVCMYHNSNTIEDGDSSEGTHDSSAPRFGKRNNQTDGNICGTLGNKEKKKNLRILVKKDEAGELLVEISEDTDNSTAKSMGWTCRTCWNVLLFGQHRPHAKVVHTSSFSGARSSKSSASAQRQAANTLRRVRLTGVPLEASGLPSISTHRGSDVAFRREWAGSSGGKNPGMWRGLKSSQRTGGVSAGAPTSGSVTEPAQPASSANTPSRYRNSNDNNNNFGNLEHVELQGIAGSSPLPYFHRNHHYKHHLRPQEGNRAAQPQQQQENLALREKQETQATTPKASNTGESIAKGRSGSIFTALRSRANPPAPFTAVSGPDKKQSTEQHGTRHSWPFLTDSARPNRVVGKNAAATKGSENQRAIRDDAEGTMEGKGGGGRLRGGEGGIGDYGVSQDRQTQQWTINEKVVDGEHQYGLQNVDARKRDKVTQGFSDAISRDYVNFLSANHGDASAENVFGRKQPYDHGEGTDDEIRRERRAFVERRHDASSIELDSSSLRFVSTPRRYAYLNSQAIRDAKTRRSHQHSTPKKNVIAKVSRRHPHHQDSVTTTTVGDDHPGNINGSGGDRGLVERGNALAGNNVTSVGEHKMVDEERDISNEWRSNEGRGRWSDSLKEKTTHSGARAAVAHDGDVRGHLNDVRGIAGQLRANVVGVEKREDMRDDRGKESTKKRTMTPSIPYRRTRLPLGRWHSRDGGTTTRLPAAAAARVSLPTRQLHSQEEKRDGLLAPRSLVAGEHKSHHQERVEINMRSAPGRVSGDLSVHRKGSAEGTGGRGGDRGSDVVGESRVDGLDDERVFRSWSQANFSLRISPPASTVPSASEQSSPASAWKGVAAFALELGSKSPHIGQKIATKTGVVRLSETDKGRVTESSVVIGGSRSQEYVRASEFSPRERSASSTVTVEDDHSDGNGRMMSASGAESESDDGVLTGNRGIILSRDGASSGRGLLDAGGKSFEDDQSSVGDASPDSRSDSRSEASSSRLPSMSQDDDDAASSPHDLECDFDYDSELEEVRMQKRRHPGKDVFF